MNKPVVLVDLDGVCYDFDGWIYERREFWPSLTQNRAEQRAYFLTDEVTKADAQKMREHVNGSRIFRELDVLPGAIEGMHALAEVADVWICTKPLEANANCRDDKAYRVRMDFGPEFEQRLIITPDKAMVSGSILLDDHPKPSQIARATWKPIIYSQPFNGWDGGDGPYDDYPHFTWQDSLEDLLHWTNPASWA